MTIRPRILMTNEASVLNTGYSVYGREVLKRLYNSGKYEIAELACYIKPHDERLRDIPWKVYPNVPPDENPEYDRLPTNEFGEWSFNNVCLDFKPHIVFDIRDYWMQTFLSESPFRRLYHLALLAPVDSIPQNEQWVDFYNEADAIFTYTDWGGKILKSQCNTIKYITSAPPVASDDFFPIPEYDREKIKSQLGLAEYTILGTVMRNQRRKLFPDLFRAFRKLLDQTTERILLYCHTGYPDLGWELPKLLLQYGISNKVLFTYICNNQNCRHILPHFYSNSIMPCPKCGQVSMSLSNVHNGAENQILNFIYNCMDLYIQYSNKEGFGMPILEAAACGVPVCGVNYSAMSENINKLNGILIDPIYLYTEVESGVYSAIPDENSFVHKVKNFLHLSKARQKDLRQKTRQLFEENYGSWDNTANKWMNYFDTVNIDYYEQMWRSPKRLHNPIEPNNVPYTNTEFVNWLMVNVLGDPSKVGSYMAARLIRDLNNGCTVGGINGKYYSEDSFKGSRVKYYPFDRQKAYEHCHWLCQQNNMWESLR